MKNEVMQVQLGFFLACLLCFPSNTYGQEVKNKNIDKKYTYFLSFGAGVSALRNIQDDIYQDNHNNYQIGVLVEKLINPKSSFISGLELDIIKYQFDGFFIQSNNKLQFVLAQPNFKYTKLTQFIINIPSQVRFPLNKSRKIFIQTGFRLGLPVITNFSYRENNKRHLKNLSMNQSKIVYQVETLIGFSENCFKKIELLNGTTLGIMYQINPIFKPSKLETKLSPVHLTWRFLF
jgi:hypothetical protein